MLFHAKKKKSGPQVDGDSVTMVHMSLGQQSGSTMANTSVLGRVNRLEMIGQEMTRGAFQPFGKSDIKDQGQS